MFTRMRLLVATVALVVAAPLALGSATAVADTAAPDTDQAKKSRTIYLKGKEPKPGKFVAYGRTTPNYENRKVIVQRKLKSATKWGNYKTIKTNSKSKYRTRIGALNRKGIVCYRIKIKGNKTFKTSYSRNITDDNGVQISSRKVCIRTY